MNITPKANMICRYHTVLKMYHTEKLKGKDIFSLCVIVLVVINFTYGDGHETKAKGNV